MPTTDLSASRFRVPHWGWFLLATILLILAGLGLLLWMPYYRERQVARKIESWKGTVVFASEGPLWLKQLAGQERLQGLKVFDRIVNVDLTGTAVTDTDLKHLLRLTHLDRLSLDATAVTDRGVANLCGLTKNECLLVNLKELSLFETAVTGEGIKRFRAAQPGCKISY